MRQHCLAVSLLLTLLLFADGATCAEPLLAFPGADGFAAYTRGGREGRVVRVTNLKASGVGSFAWALNDVKEPRTIVFDVSGVIDCRNEVAFRINSDNDHVTIAGETSPGGVAIYNYQRFEIRDGAEQVIMRFLRFRGTRIHTRNDPDGLLLWRAQNVIVDHCSFAGSCDETISGSNVKNVTIQWTGFDESRKDRAHNDYFTNNGQWHNYGGLYTRAKNVSIHHCLFAHHAKRNPRAQQDSYVEAVNNVIYNYSNSQQTYGAAGDGLKIAYCYFKLGPDRRRNAVPVGPDVIAVKGCVSKQFDGSPGPPVRDAGKLGRLTLFSATIAERAYADVLRLAGALPHDATSRRMVKETMTGTGSQGYQANLRADHESLNTKASLPDLDRDGLPDAWERTQGLDPKNHSDSIKKSPSGYTYLETYCHLRAKQLIAGAIPPDK